MEMTFIVEQGFTDSQHDRLMPGAFKDLPKKVFIVKDFDSSQVLGKANVFYDNSSGSIKATADIKEELLPLYPAIGLNIIDTEIIDGIKVITNAKMFAVGLCINQNVDPTILPLKDQQL